MKKLFVLLFIIVLLFCCSNLFASIPSSFYDTGCGINSGDDEYYTLTANWSVPSNTVLMVGGEGKATITQTGGTSGTFQVLSMGFAKGGEGYWIQNGGAVNATLPVIGSGGKAVFTQNAGINNFVFMGIGQRSSNYATAVGGQGEYQLNGGTLNIGQIFLGDTAGCRGNFVMTDGELIMSGGISVNPTYGQFLMSGGLFKTTYYTPVALTNLFNTTLQHTGEVVIGTDGQYTTAYVVPEPCSILLLGIGLFICKHQR